MQLNAGNHKTGKGVMVSPHDMTPPEMPPGIRPGELPSFHKLTEYPFQDLCRDLFAVEPGIATCVQYGTRGQTQYGIDMLAHCKDGDGIEVGQCKCYKKFSPPEFRNTLRSSCLNVRNTRLNLRHKT